MAYLNVEVTDVIDGKGSLTITISKDVPVDEIMATLKEVFETEIYGARIKISDQQTTISVETKNQERLEIIKSAVIKLWKDRLEIPTRNN